MVDLLPPAHLLGAYLLACLVLAITPGPGVFYVVTRSLLQGRSSGIASVTGLALGTFINAIIASIGLAALFSVSALAFTVVKLVGAGYLVYLGIRTIRQKHGEDGVGSLSPMPSRRIFVDGAIVGLFNPKTALFFAAFLPQFMVSTEQVVLQSMMLGAMFIMIAMTTDLLYVLFASHAHQMLSTSPRARRGGRWIAGSAFIGLGIFTALLGGRQKA